jgi:ribosomal protein L4
MRPIQLTPAVAPAAPRGASQDSKALRRGKGKMRNRRYVLRKGPLVVYSEDNGISKAFRNLPGGWQRGPVSCTPRAQARSVSLAHATGRRSPPPPPPGTWQCCLPRHHGQPLQCLAGVATPTPALTTLITAAGVEVASVERLNLLQLAPGGHLGRFCIWTQGAFEKLDSIFGG